MNSVITLPYMGQTAAAVALAQRLWEASFLAFSYA